MTEGAVRVMALGGDDLICVTGGLQPVVDAGAGNDSVDASADPAGSLTALGEGDDRYVGSRAHDVVDAGTPHDGTQVDTGRDVVDTGPRGAIEDVVTEHGQTVLDMHGHFYGHGFNGTENWYASDCTHPNATGHDQLHRLVYRTVTGEDL